MASCGAMVFLKSRKQSRFRTSNKNIIHQIKILLQDFKVSETRCLWGTLPPNGKALCSLALENVHRLRKTKECARFITCLCSFWFLFCFVFSYFLFFSFPWSTITRYSANVTHVAQCLANCYLFSLNSFASYFKIKVNKQVFNQ